MTRQVTLSLTALLLGSLMLGACRRRKNSSDAPGRSTARPVNVVVGTLQPYLFEDRLEVQGTVKAVRYANIAARIPGTLDELPVEEGDAVQPGALLFQTDKVNLENSVEAHRQELAVARAAVDEAKAGRRQKQAAFDKSALDEKRFKQLFEEQQAVTRDAVEKMESARKQAAAGVDYAKAVQALAEAREAQAESALKIALKQLADSRITAPFAGRVVHKFHEKGEFVPAGNPVLRIEDPNDLEVSFFVDAARYPRIVPGRTPAVVSSNERKVADAPVSWRAPIVDPATRTFEVKVHLPGPAGLAPGMLCDIRLVLASRRGRGLPRRAVRDRAGTKIVFVAEGAVARAVPVHTGLATDGVIEITDPEALDGKQVVVQGQVFLEDGAPIRIVDASSPGTSGTDAPVKSTPPSGRNGP